MDLEVELKQKIDSQELEKRITQKIKSFEGLINKNAAIRLIAKEEGILKDEDKSTTIKEIEKNSKSVNIRAKIAKIWPIASYSSGKKSRVYELEDESGKIPLILWNEDIARFSGLRNNDLIRLKSAYESGGELHLGYNGQVNLVKRAELDSIQSIEERSKNEDSFIVNIRGILDGTCIDSDGEITFSILNNQHKIQCLLCEGIERREMIDDSIEVIIEKGRWNGKGIVIDSQTRVLCKKKPQQMDSVIEIFEDNGNAVIITASGRRSICREEFLKMLKISVADDIKTSTLISLQKDRLINRKITLDKKENEG